jgi:hypothetical protein
MDFDVRFIVRDCFDYYYYYRYNHLYRYFTQFALSIHENSINNLKILTWILNVLTGKVINKFQMTQNRALTN